MVQQIKEKRRYVKSPNWKPRPSVERKVMVWHTVKRKHFEEAMEAIKEVLKQYR